MPEPEINDLYSSIAPTLDKIPVLSNDGSEPKSKRRRSSATPSYMSEAEIGRLMSAVSSVRDRAIFSLAYHRGLRASEVGMLQMRDYTPPSTNCRYGQLQVNRLKDSLSGLYQLTRSELKDLKAWLRVRGTGAGVLFPSSRRRPISRKMLDVLIKGYGEAAGIPKDLRHFHALKHSCAVHLLLKGLGVDQVQQWLGHRNIQSTMIYLRIANVRLDDAAKLLANW
jgi:integrase